MMNFKREHITCACWILLMCFIELNSASAQTTTPEKKWNFLTEVYLMFPYMDGAVGVGNEITAPVDANPGDIFNKLKFAAMLYVEVHTDKWALTSDIVYMNLSQEVTPGTLLHSGTVTAKQFVWEAAGLCRLTPSWR